MGARGVGAVLDPVRRGTVEGAFRVRRRRQPLDLLDGRPGGEGALSLLEEFVAGDLIAQAPSGRILASVLFTDIVDSTARAAALGDGLWAQVLDRHDAIARSAISIERTASGGTRTALDTFAATRVPSAAKSAGPRWPTRSMPTAIVTPSCARHADISARV